MARRVGRRPGRQDTRGAILAAAREVFAERGYDGASIRQVATGADVDPALVHHYFGTKEQLFLAVVQPPVNPAELVPKIMAGDLDRLGERLVGTFLSVFESPVTGPAFEALLRGAFANQLSSTLIREFFAVQIIRRVVRELGAVVDAGELPLRANLAASQLLGLAATRYVIKFQPIASAPQQAVIAAVAPTIQRYLTGDIGAVGETS
ncbi:MAG TPA: TetR family transcriptional regulator [Jiangellaceae bacterium]|nr:TetR family transcriptional regulator [Jiangellaceae bacterium]